MAYVRLYRYRILPGRMAEARGYLEDAARIYREYGLDRILILEDAEDPGSLLDMSFAADEETYAEKQRRLDRDPHIETLFQAFVKTLAAPDIETRHYQTIVDL